MLRYAQQENCIYTCGLHVNSVVSISTISIVVFFMQTEL